VPYPNEHAARIKKPGDFEKDSFRRKKITDGIDIIVGKLKGESKTTTQAYRFKKDKYTADEAKKWLKDNEVKYISFEPATEEKKSLFDTIFEEEYRFNKITTHEFRIKENDDKNQLVGYATPFNSWSGDLGGFKEIVRPGTFRKTIKEKDVVSTFNHDFGNILGRRSNNTLQLKEDDYGLRYEVDLPGTTVAQDLKILVKRKDVKGSSFFFRTIKDMWNDNYTKRELLEVELIELGPVTMPAYAKSKVSARSYFNNIGINFNALYMVLNKSKRNLELNKDDEEIINHAIDKLQRCLPKIEPIENHSIIKPDDHSILTRAKNLEVMAKIKLLEVI